MTLKTRLARLELGAPPDPTAAREFAEAAAVLDALADRKRDGDETAQLEIDRLATALDTSGKSGNPVKSRR